MKKRQSTIDQFIRGGDVFRNRFSMFFASAGLGLLIGCCAAVAITYGFFRLAFSGEQQAIVTYYIPARAFDVLGLGKLSILSRQVEIAGIRVGRLRPTEIVVALAKPFSQYVEWKSWLMFLVFLSSYGVSTLAILKGWLRYGAALGKDEFRRGAQQVEVDELASMIRARHPVIFEFAGVPVPRGHEMRNFLATGAMGSGKSVALLGLADQVARAGRKMVVYDKVGEFTEAYFRPGIDLILNPFDSRSVTWNVFREIRAIYDYDMLAAALIHDAREQAGNEQFFKAGARALFSAVLQALYREGRRQTHDLADAILKTPAEELAAMVQGTPAEAFITPKAAQQAGGVVAELVGALVALQYIGEGGFSIREWMARDDDSRLFITSHESIHDAIRPLVGMWIEIALRAAMARERTREDRVWVFLDELPSIGNLSILKQSLVEARKYGVVHVIGLQNIAQMRETFGRDVAQTLRSNLQNFLVLRVADEDTAESYSKLLGSFEQDELDEGLSFGPASSRDGSSQQTSRKEVRLVMPAELQRLPDCAGYVQIAGAWPLAKVTYRPTSRAVVAQGFVERADLGVETQVSTKSADDAVSTVGPISRQSRAVRKPAVNTQEGSGAAHEVLQALAEDLQSGAKAWGTDAIRVGEDVFIIWPAGVEGYGIDPETLLTEMQAGGQGELVTLAGANETGLGMRLSELAAKLFPAEVSPGGHISHPTDW